MKAWLQLMGEAASSLNARLKRNQPSPTVRYRPPDPPPPPPPAPVPAPPSRKPSNSQSHKKATQFSGKQPARLTPACNKMTDKPKPPKKPINFGFYPPEYERKFKDERLSFRKPRKGLYR